MSLNKCCTTHCWFKWDKLCSLSGKTDEISNTEHCLFITAVSCSGFALIHPHIFLDEFLITPPDMHKTLGEVLGNQPSLFSHVGNLTNRYFPLKHRTDLTTSLHGGHSGACPVS